MEVKVGDTRSSKVVSKGSALKTLGGQRAWSKNAMGDSAPGMKKPCIACVRSLIKTDSAQNASSSVFKYMRRRAPGEEEEAG